MGIRHRLGILQGEGIGPSVIAAGLVVLEKVSSVYRCSFETIFGGPIGCDSDRQGLGYLSESVIGFCREIFMTGGVIWAGAGGGRFVYAMREEFGLYYKLNPIHSYVELAGACRLKQPLQPIDLLVIRENLQGLYQGDAQEISTAVGREIHYTFRQGERPVRDVLQVAAQEAERRRRKLTIVCKDAGLPLLHSLWRQVAEEVMAGRDVETEFLDIDYAVYKLVQQPEVFDVIVAPNCFGDILADLGGVIAGSRGVTYGASFSKNGHAVYQTNHGAAYNLTGLDQANPVGQILSLALALKTSLGLVCEGAAMENAIREVWRNGWRTADLAEPGGKIIGTREFAQRVAENI